MITRTNDQPTLEAIDGRVLGRVMLMSIRIVDPAYEEPEPLYEDITEGDHDEDPWTFALGLQRGIERDFPDREWAIVGNWRARYLRWVHQMNLMPGPGEYPPQEYLALWKKERGDK
jgi:hypothetical protein